MINENGGVYYGSCMNISSGDSMRIFAHQSGKKVGLKIKLVAQSIDRDGEKPG
jgi:hypothetical protein